METRGPWTAKPALIKVDEIRNIKKCTCKKYSKLVQFSEKRHSVSYTVVKTATHKALFSSHIPHNGHITSSTKI